MAKTTDPVYSRSVIEFVAAANEFCRYAEQAQKLKGDELLKIFQRIIPYLYIKASLLPELQPVFEDGSEKFVTEPDWTRIRDVLREKFGSADAYVEVMDSRASDTEPEIAASISEDMADIYQDVKDFLLLYQTGTNEVMNDAVWECRLNFENIWGQKLVNSLRAIHRFIYSGEEIEKVDEGNEGDTRDTSDWFISRRQKDLNEDGE